jgi:hypothetical protein
LHNLKSIYCPLRLPPLVTTRRYNSSAYVDSGYVSEDEVAVKDVSEDGENLAVLSADEFERTFAGQWLTGLISRAEELPFEEEVRTSIVDEASFILSSFSDSDHDTEHALTRDFVFPTSLSSEPITVSLNDAPLSGTDHTDVGLQSWGASIVFSELMCVSPELFRLDQLPDHANIIELGAGTGLISLTLAKLLPRLPVAKPSIIATDYHLTVLDNLQTNIAASFPSSSPDSSLVKTMLLDWSAPPGSLHSCAHMLLAADVVYAPEHAKWLRDCAAQLLAPDGTFWLVVTVRSTGKFEGIPATAEAAFEEKSSTRVKDGRLLSILEKRVIGKQKGIGRDDEKGYIVFKIGWVDLTH